MTAPDPESEPSSADSGGEPDATTDPTDGPERPHEALRDLVLATPERVESGFTPLATERDTPAGPVDVYGEDAAGRQVVVELKGSRAGPDAVGQLQRYVEALGRDLHDGAEVRGILVAPAATDRARRMLDERELSFVALAP